MRFLTKLIFAGGLIYIGARYGRPLVQRLLDSMGSTTDTDDEDGMMADEVVIVGIAEVDPEPLSTMGEAIDPDAVEAAHQSVPDRLEELRNKNIP